MNAVNHRAHLHRSAQARPQADQPASSIDGVGVVDPDNSAAPGQSTQSAHVAHSVKDESRRGETSVEGHKENPFSTCIAHKKGNVRRIATTPHRQNVKKKEEKQKRDKNRRISPLPPPQS